MDFDNLIHPKTVITEELAPPNVKSKAQGSVQLMLVYINRPM